MALERTAGQVVLLVTGAVVLLVRPSPVLAPVARFLASPAVALALAVTGLLVVAVAVRLRRRRGASRGERALRTVLAEARQGLLARGVWPGVALSSVAVLAGYLGMFVLAARVAGVTAPTAELVPLVVLALLAMALPLNVGGWGPREGVAAWAFGAAGLGATQGLTTAVIYGVLAFVASLPGAAVLLGPALRRSAPLPAEQPVPSAAVPRPADGHPRTGSTGMVRQRGAEVPSAVGGERGTRRRRTASGARHPGPAVRPDRRTCLSPPARPKAHRPAAGRTRRVCPRRAGRAAAAGAAPPASPASRENGGRGYRRREGPVRR